MPNLWLSPSSCPMGYAFHELIALPTLAPALARPEFRAPAVSRDTPARVWLPHC